MEARVEGVHHHTRPALPSPPLLRPLLLLAVLRVVVSSPAPPRVLLHLCCAPRQLGLLLAAASCCVPLPLQLLSHSCSSTPAPLVGRGVPPRAGRANVRAAAPAAAAVAQHAKAVLRARGAGRLLLAARAAAVLWAGTGGGTRRCQRSLCLRVGMEAHPQPRSLLLRHGVKRCLCHHRVADVARPAHTPALQRRVLQLVLEGALPRQQVLLGVFISFGGCCIA